MKHQTRGSRPANLTFRLRNLLMLATASAVMLTACAGVLAQEESVVFERLSLEEGLSQSIVECIIQDARGFMWFGTQDGLNRYDGYQFTVLRQDPQDANSLSHNNILSLYEDQTGLIWVGTFNAGLNSYDPRTERFRRFRANRDDPNSLSNDYIRVIYVDISNTVWIGTALGLNRYDRAADRFVRFLSDPANPRTLSNNLVRKICEDRSGLLWIGTDDGLNRLDPRTGEFTRYYHHPDDPRSLSDNAIRALHLDREGMLWVGTENGLNRLDPETGTCIRYQNDPENPYSLSHNAVYSIHEDSRPTLWIGTNGGGLNRFDRKTGKFHSYRNNPCDQSSLSYDEIYSLCEDESGVLWIGTWGGGIDKVDTKKKEFLHYRRDPNNLNSLSHDIVWSIYEDESGILWIGTHGGGLNRFDRRANRFTHYRHDPQNPNSLSSDIVRIVIEDRSGMLWLGTNGGGIDKFDRRTGRFTNYRNNPSNPKSLSQDEIRCMYQDRAGALWIGTNGGGLNRFDSATAEFTRYRNNPLDSTSLSNDYVRVVYEDSSGVLWVGTQGGGLNRFDRRTEQFRLFRENPNDPNSINNDFIMWIYESRAGVMWILTWGGGLNRFDREMGRFRSYTEENGLASNATYGALEDGAGRLWISTNNGLSRFDPKTETFKNYGVPDGLQSTEFNTASFFESRSGEMFFGGISGFNAFHPEAIKDNQHVPPIVITSFTKLNHAVKLDKPIWEQTALKLSYRDYVFSFEFAALDYNAPAKNRYAYKMDGLDRDWFYTDAGKRYANYTTLPAGKYVFRVKGSNNDGVWNEKGASIDITITPPFWGTWWFRSLAGIVLVTLGVLWYRRRLKTVRLTTELQAAHNAQMSIMPHGDPKVQGFDISGVCIPASEVGGDFFDYFWLDEKETRFGLAVGDVSGKAMDAAMIAVMSSGMIASNADESFSPRETMTRLNRPLHAKTRENTFTALWLGALDVATRTFAFTNAGIVDPLLKSGQLVIPLMSAGPRLPLGSIKGTVYEEKNITLNQGDVLVLFTDGVTDARNNDRDFYEYENLKKLLEKMDAVSLPAREIKDRIVEDVRRFMGATPQYDDMTVVVVKAV
jgi:ligand-binding sensor domain-containing protein